MIVLAEAGLDTVWQHKEGGVLLLSVLTDADAILNACSNLRMPPCGQQFVSGTTLTIVMESSLHKHQRGVCGEVVLPTNQSTLVLLMWQIAIDLASHWQLSAGSLGPCS